MKTVLLFRHGETRLPGCKGKKLGCPLSDSGEAQTRRNVAYAMEICREHLEQTLVVTSPLPRASFFGQVWREIDDRSTHIATPEWTDLDVGDWEGKEWDFIKQKYPREYQIMKTDGRNLTIPGGERVDLYVDRILNTWRRFLAMQYKNLVMVGHSATNVPVIADAEGHRQLDFSSQDHGCMNHILVDDAGQMMVIDKNVILPMSVHA